MISMSWKRIRNQKYKSIITIFAMVAIILLTSYGIQTSRDTQLIVTEGLENYSRGSYDILVRPEGARTDIEEHLQTVEENYIGDGSGGITIEEWENIKAHPEIEIAAPVASLGYFTGNTTSIRLHAVDYPARYGWRFFTSDGMNTYPVTPSHGTYFFQVNDDEHQAADTYPDLSKEIGEFSGGLNISFPKNYYLLTAIDAESEGLLTGIDFSELFREYTAEEATTIGTFSDYRDDAPVIPILQRENLQIPLSMQVTVEKLDVSLDEIYEKFDMSEDDSIGFQLQFFENEIIKEFEDYLPTLRGLGEETFHIDLTNFQSPFDGTHLIADEVFNVDIPGDGRAGSLYNDSGLYYTASKIDYSIKDHEIHVNVIEEGPPPEYKKLEELGRSYLNDWTAPFMLWQKGTFLAEDEENTLTSSPLGIYSTKDVKTLDGTTMTLTITPGSFIAAPTAGVTTIEAASIIKGDEPIDAIRIKLNNITAYDKKAQERIEALATELSHEGYVVDIVAGSSFRSVNMTVEGIGEVTSPWTTLGVAQLLANAWDIDTVLGISLFSLFGLFWFFSHLGFERNRLDKENDILYFLGWKKRDIRTKNITEQLILVLFSIVMSTGIALSLGLSSLAFIVIGGFLFTSIFLIATIFYMNPRQNTRSNKYRFLASIQYYKTLLIPTMLALMLAVSITQLQIASIYELWTTSTETTLGTFIFEENLYIRILIVIATVLLSVLVLIEAIQGIIYARQDEFQMYYVIGWTEKMVRFHFLKEVAIWASLSLMIGVILSSIVSILLDISLLGVGLGILTSSVIYFMIVFTAVIFRKYR